MIFKKMTLLLSLYLLITPVCFPQMFDKNILKGLEHSYHFRWNKAEDTFREMIDKYPERPEGYHFLSSIYAWYYLSSKDEADYNLFTSYSDSAIEKGLDELDRNPSDSKLMYIIGSNYSYRAIVFAAAENYLDAVWAGKKSDSYLNDALKTYPESYDAYLGLGLFNFAAGQTPAAFKWALKLVGIMGDTDTGIEQIKIAADKGFLSRVEAQYYYSQITADYSTASEYLISLVKKYPGNILFNYSLASLNIKQRDLDNAEKILRKLINRKEEKFVLITSFSNFLLGDVFYRKNEFDSSAVYYRRFLETTPDNDYTGIASFRLGVSFEITGQRDSAVVYFEKCGNGNMDLDDDIYAKRKGAVYSRRTLSENEISVIKASNMIEFGKFKAAYDSLTGLLENLISTKLKAETYLYLSEAAFYLGSYQESLSLASAALKTDVQDEKWILAFANYYAARSNKELGDNLAMNYFIEEAEEFSDYDYQNKMKNLLFSLKHEKHL